MGNILWQVEFLPGFSPAPVTAMYRYKTNKLKIEFAIH